MASKFPKGFAVFIVALLLLLLAGYLWLAEIVPKQGSSTVHEQESPTASTEPQTQPENITTWTDYRDPQYGFSLRYPKAWAASATTEDTYTVRFASTNGSAGFSVRVYKGGDKKAIIASIKKSGANGLFPAADTEQIKLLDGSEAPAFIDYTSPHGDITISSAVIERQGTVYVFEEQRSIFAPAKVSMFDIWVRSFTI
jgi:hypothetical protein